MSEAESPYALGRLILDYIRSFLWPAVALIVVFVYQDDVRTLLFERQVDIFGLRIGERVQEVESQALAEIADIRALLDELQTDAATPELQQDIGEKLTQFERNLSREIAQVRTAPAAAAPVPVAAAVQAPAADARSERAGAAERAGFEALLARDADAALRHFDAARGIWPEYHNVAEIGRLLRKWEERLSSRPQEAWPALYREILTRYSWGMPNDLRPALRSAASAAYN